MRHKVILFRFRLDGMRKLLEWLSHRKQNVGLKLCFSGLKSLFAGESQGTVLGTLSFLFILLT